MLLRSLMGWNDPIDATEFGRAMVEATVIKRDLEACGHYSGGPQAAERRGATAAAEGGAEGDTRRLVGS